ncbi:hypothetical protein LABALGNA3A7_02160 [Dellaglioa algida]|nr:hypothetical protein LABALGNA3A7_02160 [Dellaglioa algida]
MPDIIPFPGQEKQNYQLAKKAIIEQNYQLATQLFTKNYIGHRSFKTNKLLVNALVLDEQFDEALAIADEFYGEYLKRGDQFAIYINILLKNNKFIQAWKLVKQQPFATPIVENAENEYRENAGKQLRQNERQFSHLGSMDFFGQQQIVQTGLILPKKEFIEACQIIFIDKDVHPIIKSSLLQEVQSIPNNIDILDYLWIDGTHKKVNMKNLVVNENEPVVRKINQLTKNDDGTVDVQLNKSLNHMLNLKLGMIYPFTGLFLGVEEEWIELVKSELGIESTFKTTENLKDMISLDQLISRELTEIMN